MGRMVRPLCTIVCALTVALSGAAPSQAPATTTGIIGGRVVDAGGREALSGVLVILGTHAAPAPASAQLVVMTTLRPAPVNPRRVLTSESGRFVFTDLPPGRYDIGVVAPGYVDALHGQARPDGPGQPLELASGQRVGDVTVRAWKLGSISGTVLDERGEPAVGIQVRYLRRTIAGGHARFANITVFSSTTTDDRGMYRIAGLPPGDYAVGVMFSPQTVPVAAIEARSAATDSGNPNSSAAYRSMTNSMSAIVSAAGVHLGDLVLQQSATSGGALPPPAPDGALMTYLTQFYPAAPTPSQSSLVTLAPGEDRSGIDLQLRLVRAVRVSGRVMSADGDGGFLGMTLVPVSGGDYQSEGAAEAASTVSDAAGRFTFLGVPPGEYLIKVRRYPRPVPAGRSQATLTPIPGGARGRAAPPPVTIPDEPAVWAVTPISIGERDVTDAVVTLRHGLRVAGRVQYRGRGMPPPVAQQERLQVTLQNAEGRTSSPLPTVGRAFADGTFRTGAYAGGRYILAINAPPAGWTMTSAMLNGRDISNEPVDLDADIDDVVITLSDQTTVLSGKVTASERDAPEAEVVVFPSDTLAWQQIGVTTRRSRLLRPVSGGEFSSTGLPPGEYYVVAVPSAAIREWNDPKFLQLLIPHATRVALADGERKAIDLKIATVR